ncbi:18830_t:CDS:2 [Gigaspora margarita]|uniref:18830_t:CDS:1 n=1 Tax=Gigaspora margarita TaxID=4874 RepID=A0ABM8W292_GIGMA|nr:18830_t:CDS:2 [Gigaspora margarita]
MFEEIFKKNRTTEPKSVFVFRLVANLLLSIILVLYTVFLILEIYNDQPVIVDSVIETNFLPVPDSGTSEYNKECMKYVKQPSESTSSEYNGGFQGTDDLTFSTSSNRGLSSIGIMIYGDTTSNSAMNLSTYKIKISRNVKEIIRKNFKNDLGLVPDLVKLTYITSTQELLPTTNSSTPQNLFIELIIEPQSFIVQVQTDKRLKTVLTSFGLLGGAYGLAISLLVLLFGNNTINPWGFVQRHNKTMQTNLMTFSELIPNSNNSDSEVSTQELKDLKQKLDLLQLLLSDYLVNAQYLEKVQELEMKSDKECNS